MRRINSSRGQREQADRAIDLGLALEVLTTNSDPQKTEVRFRVSVRASLLLAGTAEERRRNRKLAADLYDQRSAAAHSGVVSEKFDKLKDNADELVCQLALAIAKRGRFPNWNDLQVGIDHS